ncbi:MAG: hypothetical protein ACI9TB_000813 [Parasphingorhabdus sp.]|jgi:hypothetical protein|uniref:hypothetical protein n=1 Tax=Parasphingorhabdus sp. TaxID=2709688 RepID=UPI0039E504A1
MSENKLFLVNWNARALLAVVVTLSMIGTCSVLLLFLYPNREFSLDQGDLINGYLDLHVLPEYSMVNIGMVSVYLLSDFVFSRVADAKDSLTLRFRLLTFVFLVCVMSILFFVQILEITPTRIQNCNDTGLFSFTHLPAYASQDCVQPARWVTVIGELAWLGIIALILANFISYGTRKMRKK